MENVSFLPDLQLVQDCWFPVDPAQVEILQKEELGGRNYISIHNRS